MSLASQVAALATRIAAEIKQVRSEMGGDTYLRRWDYKTIVCLGDSLLAGPAPDYVAEALPWATVVKAGFSGYRSTEIAMKWGVPAIFSAFTVPSTTATTVVSIVSPLSSYGGGTWVGEMRDANGVVIPGTLTRDATTWRFARTAAGTSTPLAGPVTFVCTEFANRRAATLVVNMGRNNITDVDTVVRDFRAILGAHEAPSAAVIFCSIPLGNNEGVDTENYALVTAINDAMRRTFPENYLDVNDYTYYRGLTAQGITPTPADLTNMAFQRLPDTLTSDGLHDSTIGAKARAVAILKGLERQGAIKGAHNLISGVATEDPLVPLIWDANDITANQGVLVPAWYDKYGRKMRANAGQQPFVTLVNGRKFLRFDGIDDHMWFDLPFDIPTPASFVIRCILRSTASKNHGLLWGNAGQTLALSPSGAPSIGGGPAHSVGVPLNTPVVVYGMFNGSAGGQVSFDNQVTVNAATPSAPLASGNFRLGYSWAGSAAYANIDVSHVAVFQGAMTNAALQQYGRMLV